MIEPHTSLSEAGQLRREHILKLAIAQSQRRRRQRVIRRTALVIVALTLAASLLMRMERADHRPVEVARTIQRTAPSQQPVQPAPRRFSDVSVVRIRDEPDLARRLAVPTVNSGWQKIGDDELLEGLSAAGQPAGLAFIAGRQVLLFRQRPVDAH